MANERIRVLIAGIPVMLTELVASNLASDRDIELMVSEEISSLAVSVERQQPDVLITGSFDAEMLYAAPRMQVYVLASDASTVRRIDLRPVSEEMGAISLTELVSAIKAARVGLETSTGRRVESG